MWHQSTCPSSWHRPDLNADPFLSWWGCVCDICVAMQGRVTAAKRGGCSERSEPGLRGPEEQSTRLETQVRRYMYMRLSAILLRPDGWNRGWDFWGLNSNDRWHLDKTTSVYVCGYTRFIFTPFWIACMNTVVKVWPQYEPDQSYGLIFRGSKTNMSKIKLSNLNWDLLSSEFKVCIDIQNWEE